MDKTHAAKYVIENKLGIKIENGKKASLYRTRAVKAVSYNDVKTFIADSNNDIKHRRGLLKAWNIGMSGKYLIPMPDELKPKVSTVFTQGFDFRDYDSSDDDEMDIEQTRVDSKSQEVTIRRDDGREVKVFVFGLGQTIRIGRQIVKRDEYEDYLPMVAQSGEHYVEFHRPTKSDIFAFPLRKKTEGEKSYFERGGNTSTFTWKKLGNELEEEVPKENQKVERATKRRRIFDTFRGSQYQEMTSGEFGAVCAIGCDWMKGSGNKTFIQKVGDNYELDISFDDLFGVTSPKYVPAGSGGRKLVTEETKKLKSNKRKIDQT